MRIAARLTGKDFLKLFIQQMDDFDWDVRTLFLNNRKVGKDLSKICFDWENYSNSFIEGLCSVNIGYKKFYFYLGWAGGDWESPVYYILYFDKKNKLRGYIPKEGNTYNLESKEAYGNSEDENEEEREFCYSGIIKDILSRIRVED